MSSLLEESSDITLDRFLPSGKKPKKRSRLRTPKIEGNVPKIPLKKEGLAATSSTVSRTSGFYSIQKPKRKRERVNSDSLPSIPRGNARDASENEPGLGLVDSSTALGVSGSYHFVKGNNRKTTNSEVVEVSESLNIPQPIKKKGVRGSFRKLIGLQKETLEGNSSEEWYGDKPEGDKYWTVYTNDAEKDDRSIWTLLFIYISLSVAIAGILWIILK